MAKNKFHSSFNTFLAEIPSGIMHVSQGYTFPCYFHNSSLRASFSRSFILEPSKLLKVKMLIYCYKNQESGQLYRKITVEGGGVMS